MRKIHSFVFNNRLNKLFLWFSFVLVLFYLGKLMYNVIGSNFFVEWHSLCVQFKMTCIIIQLLESSYFYLHVIINKIWVYSIINLEKKTRSRDNNKLCSVIWITIWFSREKVQATFLIKDKHTNLHVTKINCFKRVLL